MSPQKGVSLWATHMLSIRMLSNFLSFKVPRTIYFHFYFTSRARNSFLFSSGKWSISTTIALLLFKTDLPPFLLSWGNQSVHSFLPFIQ